MLKIDEGSEVKVNAYIYKYKGYLVVNETEHKKVEVTKYTKELI